MAVVHYGRYAPSRWFILLVLFSARFALGFQFQAAGSVTPLLLKDFGSSYTGIGTLVGLFMVPGLFLTVPSGFLSQRYGDKRVVLVGLGLMMAGGMIAGFAQNYPTIAIGRLISGTGAAALFVLMTKMLADWFAERELFLGMSIYIIGWPIGIAAAQAVQPEIAVTTGWSIVFHITSLLSLVALLAIGIFYRPPQGLEAPTHGRFRMLDRRELILVTIAGFAWMFINGAYLVMVSFGPVLLHENDVPFSEAARATSLMSWVFLIALPAGGYLATRYRIPLTVLIAGLSGAIIVGVAILYTNLPVVTFPLFGMLYAAAAPVLASLPAQVLKPSHRAPGMGIYYIWYFVGSALLPVLGGYLRDVTGTAAASVLFAVAMILATLMLALLFHAGRGSGQAEDV